MKFALSALSLLAVTAYAADLTSCQDTCVASNLCSGTTDYLTSSCICSDDFQQNVKGCLYAAGGGCGNDVGSWFDYAEAACAAASSGSGSGAAAETASASGSSDSGKTDSTASTASGSSGSSGHGSGSASATGSSAAAATSEAKASSGSGSSSGASAGAQVPLALGALGMAGALLL